MAKTTLCTVCGAHKTSKESGVCSLCQQKRSRESKKKKYPICIQCGKSIYAPKEDGLCSDCRNRKVSGAEYCLICGRARTNHESGVCYYCRRKYGISAVTGVKEKIREVIENTKITLKIMEGRKVGKSFNELGRELSMPKHTVYGRYASECNNIVETFSVLERKSADPATE